MQKKKTKLNTRLKEIVNRCTDDAMRRIMFEMDMVCCEESVKTLLKTPSEQKRFKSFLSAVAKALDEYLG